MNGSSHEKSGLTWVLTYGSQVMKLGQRLVDCEICMIFDCTPFILAKESSHIVQMCIDCSDWLLDSNRITSICFCI